jgi:hypothetical protein
MEHEPSPSWAHGRYHALEDGYDKWIGNDD